MSILNFLCLLGDTDSSEDEIQPEISNPTICGSDTEINVSTVMQKFNLTNIVCAIACLDDLTYEVPVSTATSSSA